jgi:hypothetical protein
LDVLLLLPSCCCCCLVCLVVVLLPAVLLLKLLLVLRAGRVVAAPGRPALGAGGLAAGLQGIRKWKERVCEEPI